MLHNQAPRLMGLLLDLPPLVRRALAEHWGTEGDAASLYRAMTGPTTLRACIDGLPPRAGEVLAVLLRAPASRHNLLARMPLSAQRLDEALAALADRGLILRLPEQGLRTPRLAAGASAHESLYVPADVAVAAEAIERARG